MEILLKKPVSIKPKPNDDIRPYVISHALINEMPPIFLTPPHIPKNYPLEKYPWHLKISVECNLDFTKPQQLRKEFKTQYTVEKKLTACVEAFCDIKKIAQYHESNHTVHHWRISFEKRELSIGSFLEFDRLNRERAINLELKLDKEWEEINPLLDRIRGSHFDYPSLERLEEFRRQFLFD